MDRQLLFPERSLPLIFEPVEPEEKTLVGLVNWIQTNRVELNDLLVHHGALLFRGFPVWTAEEFESVARALDPDLKNAAYHGTAPRNSLTDYVQSSVELPGYYPIPQHIEMSYLKNKANRLFFWSMLPARNGGETPVTDFRQVYRDLPAEGREAFETRNIKIIRNYSGPGKKGRFDLLQFKGWDEIFHTTEKDEVERQCALSGTTPVWKKGNSLCLINDQSAVRSHPDTGEPVWHNHSQAFHISTAVAEYRRLIKYTKKPALLFYMLLAGAMNFIQGMRKSRDDLALHCQFQDGSEIPDSYMEAVRDAIWKNTVIFPWQKGDVLAIDNHSTAHGRMPFRGPRKTALCYA